MSTKPGDSPSEAQHQDFPDPLTAIFLFNGLYSAEQQK